MTNVKAFKVQFINCLRFDQLWSKLQQTICKETLDTKTYCLLAGKECESSKELMEDERLDLMTWKYIEVKIKDEDEKSAKATTVQDSRGKRVL